MEQMTTFSELSPSPAVALHLRRSGSSASAAANRDDAADCSAAAAAEVDNLVEGSLAEAEEVRPDVNREESVKTTEEGEGRVAGREREVRLLVEGMGWSGSYGKDGAGDEDVERSTLGAVGGKDREGDGAVVEGWGIVVGRHEGVGREEVAGSRGAGRFDRAGGRELG
jgi:hypothetical protein